MGKNLAKYIAENRRVSPQKMAYLYAAYIFTGETLGVLRLSNDLPLFGGNSHAELLIPAAIGGFVYFTKNTFDILFSEWINIRRKDRKAERLEMAVLE